MAPRSASSSVCPGTSEMAAGSASVSRSKLEMRKYLQSVEDHVSRGTVTRHGQGPRLRIRGQPMSYSSLRRCSLLRHFPSRRAELGSWCRHTSCSTRRRRFISTGPPAPQSCSQVCVH
jgi:hypothetical protein